MFNTTPNTSTRLYLAKMMAKNELIEKLNYENFNLYSYVQAELDHFSANPSFVKSQLQC